MPSAFNFASNSMVWDWFEVRIDRSNGLKGRLVEFKLALKDLGSVLVRLPGIGKACSEFAIKENGYGFIDYKSWV